MDRTSLSRGDRLGRLRFVALVLPSVLLAALVALDYFVLEPVLTSGEAHLAMLLVGVAGVITFSVAIFSRLEVLNRRLVTQNAELMRVTRSLQRRQEQLRILSVAGTALSSEIVKGTVLQRVAELARDVGAARYAALGVFDEDGRLTQFLTAGISDEERARIGDLPVGRGILGLLAREQRPIRLADLSRHAASVGFPPNHPLMKSFLGVPILYRGRSLGNLYLTEKVGGGEFSEEDEEALVSLAAKAAIAMENARLYEQVQRIAALEERHRIGMDLHDGAIQSLYGVSLVLEDAAERVDEAPAAARATLVRAVDRLNATIADLRGFVLGLAPAAQRGKPLHETLERVAEQTSASALVDVRVDVRPEAERALDESTRESVFFIAADALTNVTRHARAKHVEVRLVREGPSVVLTVVDDGVGFETDGVHADGRGLENMAERAHALGGRFLVESAPGAGTRVQVELPVGALRSTS